MLTEDPNGEVLGITGSLGFGSGELFVARLIRLLTKQPL